MLATDPRKQASGIGKKMLNHAEQYAKVNFGNVIYNMSVLSSRPELLSFYERRGYVLTGEVGRTGSADPRPAGKTEQPGA